MGSILEVVPSRNTVLNGSALGTLYGEVSNSELPSTPLLHEVKNKKGIAF